MRYLLNVIEQVSESGEAIANFSTKVTRPLCSLKSARTQAGTKIARVQMLPSTYYLVVVGSHFVLEETLAGGRQSTV